MQPNSTNDNLLKIIAAVIGGIIVILLIVLIIVVITNASDDTGEDDMDDVNDTGQLVDDQEDDLDNKQNLINQNSSSNQEDRNNNETENNEETEDNNEDDSNQQVANGTSEDSEDSIESLVDPALPTGWNQWNDTTKANYLKSLSSVEKNRLWSTVANQNTFWASLTLAQQLAFNPNNCTVNSQDVIRLSSDDASCLIDSEPYSTRNTIDLNAVQSKDELWVTYEYGSEGVNDMVDYATDDTRYIIASAYRIDNPVHCYPNAKIDISRQLIRMVSIHDNFIFKVGRSDISGYICLLATEYSSNLLDPGTVIDYHAQVVRVQHFPFDADSKSITLHVSQGVAKVFVDTYLAVNKPAWEYYIDSVIDNCQSVDFITYQYKTVSQTFTSSRILYDSNLHHYTPGVSVSLTINLDEDDVDKILCIRVRDDLDNWIYGEVIISEHFDDYPLA